ncbi:hypothetical protein ESCCO14588_0417 [Escherichia coli O157:H7 str. TW14588]|uniref:Uncharacterized protein n=1 Tax=Escherichia coli O145:H28 (strain RM12581) TaxID=1248823 RepID=A0ABC7ZZ45_ECOLR|nr:hypothetical protein ECRM13514_4643 [Escherichia coli O145:H28 str. RM13514]AHY73116.1 hypothetical protein ECRM12581_22930 [Escherichia coli O145:H28 str. RM12581]EDU88080.1 hypothetical protein ECH7EC4501_0913 [Escherichia coli O157:H7 str. EC4501]EEC29531.1 hypothetical protein ESCCO14588_0417 [Escherichia coli O157:H7 str. TW14588]
MNTFCKGVHQLFTLFTRDCSKIIQKGEQVNTLVNSFTKVFTH